LKCSDDTYYTGVTNDLEKRLSEHSEGLDKKCYTYRRRPFTLIWNECFMEINEALRAEKQIKGWCRKKKEALVNGDWDVLSELSKGHSGYMKTKIKDQNV